MSRTLKELLAQGAESATAVSAPGRPALSHGGLRRLIEENPAKARYIQTVWGVGYVFVPDGKAT